MKSLIRTEGQSSQIANINLERGNHSNTIIVGNFNPPLTPMDRSSRRKLIRKHSLK